MARNKRGHQKDSANDAEPAQKRVKTETAQESDPEAPPKNAMKGYKKKGPLPKIPTKKELFLDTAPFPEKPTAQDRINEATLYELLGSEDNTERQEAAKAIILKLLDGDGVSESLLDKHLEKRLFRGLASSRKASRLGFSLVLTDILQQLWGERDLCGDRYRGLTFRFVLNTLMEKCKPSGMMAGQEEKDHYFGQLFGVECFVRAKVLFDDVTTWHTILDLLLGLAKKKVWLKSLCAWIIIQAVPQMDQKIAEETLQKIADADWAKTSEGVAMGIVFSERFASMQLPSKHWRDPLSSKSLQDLPAVLKNSGQQEPVKTEEKPEEDISGATPQKQKKKQSSWTAQLHFVWDIILAHYIKLASSEPDNASDLFKVFWNRVVDQGFFSKSATDPQKFTGFMIFQKFLEAGASHHFIVHNLFTQNLMTCLMNQAAKQDRYLHRAAVKSLKAVENCVETQPDLLPVVLKELLGKHGAYNFDQRTNSKTIDKLLHFVKPEDASDVLDSLRRLVLVAPDGENADKHVLVFGDYIFKLASVAPTESASEKPEPKKSSKKSASSTAAQGSVAGLALQELAKIAYPKSGEVSAGLTDKTKPILRQRLTSAFAKFVKRPEDFGEFCNAIMSIDTSSIEMDDELEAELLEALEKLQVLTKPKKVKGDMRGPYQGLALLYAVAILQLFNEEPDALEVLNDLKQCYEKLESKQKDKDTGVAELLVEILLAMVARPSSLMRQTSERVFEGFTHLMTAEALILLTDTLAADENAKGLQALFDTDADMEDAEEAGDSNGSDESEIDSDVEFVSIASGEDEGVESGVDAGAEETNEPGQQGQQDQDEVEEAEKAAYDAREKQAAEDALDEALAKVLNAHRLDKDKDADSSDDDSDMSDSEMMALDEKMAVAFKMQMKDNNRKKENRDAKETVIVFKHRVLDLLAIFARKEAANPLVFRLLLPLISIMHTTKTKDLAKKAGGIIAALSAAQKKARGNKEQPMGDVDAEEQMALLKEIHEEMPNDESHAFAKAASTAALLVVTSILTKDGDMFPRIWEMYGSLASGWIKKGNFQFSVITDLTQWIHSSASHLLRNQDS